MKGRWKEGEGRELHNDELYSYNFEVMLLGESKNDGISGRKHVTGKKRKGRQFYSNLVARCRLRNSGQLTARYGVVRVDWRRSRKTWRTKIAMFEVFIVSQVATRYAYRYTPSVR
jgi:hypothetical protein